MPPLIWLYLTPLPGRSKYALALEWFSYAPHCLRCRPELVLLDAWYPSRRLPKRFRDCGWYFVCRLKKNRRFNGRTVRAYCRHPYWADIGWLTSGLKVLVVRYDAQYDATNRLILTAAEMRRMFQFRTQIEEVIRALKDQLGLTRSQACSERAAELSHLWFGGMLRTGAEEICSSYYYQSTHTATPF